MWAGIALPFAQPAVVGVAVLAATDYLASFIEPLLYIRSLGKLPLTLGLQALMQMARTDWPLLMAGAVMVTAPWYCSSWLPSGRFSTNIAGLVGRASRLRDQAFASRDDSAMGYTPSICFYPDEPEPWALVRNMRRNAGWRRTKRPEDADWCLLYRKQTRLVLANEDPYSEASWGWINGRCRDISKTTVERLFAEVFGYPLAVDPLTWQGPLLRKSDANAVKIVDILNGPIEALDEGMVYERLIDGRVGDGTLLEYRVTVVANTIPFIRLNYVDDWFPGGHFPDALFSFVGICHPDTVFAATEQALILAFASKIGIDIGELDVLRDNASQRIYIVDANNTPGSASKRSTKQVLDHRMNASIAAFNNGFPSRLTGGMLTTMSMPELPVIPDHPPIPKLPGSSR